MTLSETVGEADRMFRLLDGRTTCSSWVAASVKALLMENLDFRLSRELAIVLHGSDPARRRSRTIAPACEGLTRPVNVTVLPESTLPADAERLNRAWTRTLTTRLRRPPEATNHCLLVGTFRALRTNRYRPCRRVRVTAILRNFFRFEERMRSRSTTRLPRPARSTRPVITTRRLPRDGLGLTLILIACEADPRADAAAACASTPRGAATNTSNGETISRRRMTLLRWLEQLCSTTRYSRISSGRAWASSGTRK